MAFAGGPKVALADYKDANPTGVPATLAQASPVERGEYLAKAADCMVCHTTPGRQGICRRARLQAAVRHAVFDQHHARQGDRHRQLQRSGFPQRGAARHPPRRRAALSGDAVYVLYLYDRRRRAGDQGLSVQPAAGARDAACQHAGVSVQPALGDGVLVGGVQSGHALRAGYVEERRNGTAAPISPKRWRIAANATRRATWPSRSTTARNSPARITAGWRAFNITLRQDHRASAAGATTT